ncbi:MAG: GAF domain-containing protein [Chloroflexi bacterium]|nr:GAF domain-containing protein [Chloroflexota bacterium]
MDSLHALKKAILGYEPDPHHSMHGPMHRIIRIIWIALAVLTLTVFVASIPAYLNQFDSPIEFHIVYGLVLDSIRAGVFFFAAAAIFWLKPNDRMAIFVSTAMLTFGVAIVGWLGVLDETHSVWRWTSSLVQVLGLGLTLIVFYSFPDGKFVPRWTRPLSFLWIGWILSWTYFPSSALIIDRDNLSLPLRMLAFLIPSDDSTIRLMFHNMRFFSLYLVLLCWFGSGVFAQIYRYMRVSTPLQQQQTKWVVFGLTAAFVGYFGFQLLEIVILELYQSDSVRFGYHLIGKPLSMLLMLLMPMSLVISILRRRLWAIDPIIQSTMIYGTLTGTLALVYLGCVFLFQGVFRDLTDQESDIAIVISTLVSTSVVQPLRRRLQDFIDRRFYRERVDFRRTIVHFSREVRTIIDLQELLHILVQRTTDLLHITHGAVFLRHPDGTFQQTEAYYVSGDQECDRCDLLRVSPSDGKTLVLTLPTSQLGQLLNGRVVSFSRGKSFSLLVPLIAPRMEGNELVGTLALGSRLSGQDYSREDRTLLMSLADQAGTAIYVARLIQEKGTEEQRREKVERRLEAHRNSPIGRAETLAETMLFAPENTLITLHRLAQAAGQDPNSASLIDYLSSALDNLGAEPMAKLAEGFNYLFTSLFEPEVLPVGLRTIITQLENYPAKGLQYVCRWDPDGSHETDQQEPPSNGLHYVARALSTYQLCQKALQVSSIAQITQLLPSLRDKQEAEGGKTTSETATTMITRPFQALGQALAGLHPVAEALYAYERMDASRDKLAYLASAVERLRRVDHLARTELGSADRPVIQYIAENWLAVVTGAISDLQTRAEIVCRLLTRHTWQDDTIPLVLKLRNDGRGAALNLKITLVPAPEYTLVEQAAQINQIAPGEEVRVELRVRPHLAEGADQFRASFVILYTDPRGTDQVENFADVVRLLASEGDFQFIPNPYVVGTPLDGGSPLFFGREDVVDFIQENLAALHRNNLVLIGQRRTGKTSLLKQLPVQLGDDYLPIYLDGQALGLDPGLPNFFLSLATEIAFALEDRNFVIDLPEYDDFVDSPTTSFERRFLTQVREVIGDRHLLIMFDEFEELESAVQRGNLDASIFGFLRHIIQHSSNLSVIFCGTHRLEELAADYWNVLFNISLYRQIAYLEQPEAARLIQEPVVEYGMRYDDLALDKMWQVSAGHPYFLQLLCHSLVNRHNKTERGYVTVADVNAALDDILASGEAHFVFLWTEATPEERLVLAVLSRMIPLTGLATLMQVADYLAERGVDLERRVISDALHGLALRNILTATGEADPSIGEAYRWRLGLLGLWVERYRSLSRVVEAVQGG